MEWQKYLLQIKQMQEEALQRKGTRIRVEIETFRNPERSGLAFPKLGPKKYVGKIVEVFSDCVILEIRGKERQPRRMLQYIPIQDIYRVSFGAKKPEGCFIATAAYGSRYAEEVQLLRFIRDIRLSTTLLGKASVERFESFYYLFSPYVARAMERDPHLCNFMRKVVVTPIVKMLSLLFNC